MASNSIAAVNSKQQILIKSLEKIQLKQNVPGFSFVIVNKNTTVLSSATGVENRVSNKKMTVDSLIRIGSITKSFTALAILKLEQSKRLNLNDNVKKYTEDLPLVNQWHKKNPVKIVHLLEHTSGLLDLSQSEFSFNDGSIKSLKKAFAFAPENRQTKARI